MQTVNFDKKRIDEIISKNWGKIEQTEIVKLLNKEGLQTTTGKPWVQSLVSRYGRVNLNLSKNYSKIKDASFNKKAVDSFILENIDLKLHLLSNKLNEKGLYNPFGYPWVDSSMSKYILEVFPEYRRKNRIKRGANVQQKQEPVKTSEIKDTSLSEEQRLALIDSSIFESEGKFFTDSLAVAKIFNKEHRHVLDAIKNCECSDKFRSAEFSAHVYLDNYNRQMPKYNLTKKGFSFIVMGFTGLKASQFKEAYIEKFEELENQVKQPKQELITDPLIILSESIKAIQETRNEFNKFKLEVKSDLEQVKAEAKQVIESEVKEATKGIQAKLDKYNNSTSERIRQAQNYLNQVPIAFETEIVNFDYLEATKTIITKYANSKGCFLENKYGIYYGEVYDQFEQEYQVPFRINYKLYNDSVPKHLQYKSVIKYLKDKGLIKQLYEVAVKHCILKPMQGK